MSLIEKIDAEISRNHEEAERLYKNGRYETSRNYYNIVQTWKEAKKLILSEQKEPCEYCGETSKIEMFIHDTVEDCKWCDKEKCDNYDDSCYGIGYGAVPQKFCPNCGRPLSQPSTDAS